MEQLQLKAFNIIREEEDKPLAGEVFDWVMVFLIVLNLLFLLLETFSMPPWFTPLAHWGEAVTAVLFTLEYILRIWVAPLYYPGQKPAVVRVKYIFSFMAVIDFLSVVPFYLPILLPVNLRVLRSFRLIRLLRLIKVSRYTEAVKTLAEVFKKKTGHLVASLFVMFLLILIAALLMYDIEHEAQPQVFKNAFSSLWWALETVTTVGSGEIQPITVPGRLFGAVIAILGIGVVAVPTGIISAGFVSAVREENSAGTQGSTADEIAKYKQLLDTGAITGAEYEAKKAKLLGG